MPRQMTVRNAARKFFLLLPLLGRSYACNEYSSVHRLCVPERRFSSEPLSLQTRLQRLRGGGQAAVEGRRLSNQIPENSGNNTTGNYHLRMGVKENAALEAFYKAQRIAPEEEFDEMMAGGSTSIC